MDKNNLKLEKNDHEFSLSNRNYNLEFHKYDDGDVGIKLDYKNVILTPDQINELINWLNERN